MAAALGIAAASPAAAQSLDDTKGIVDFMVVNAYVCAGYLEDETILKEHLEDGRDRLLEAGLSSSDADAFMAGVVEATKGRTFDETQKQIACEMLNISAIEVQ